jgi:hypothetical protein
MLVSFHVAAAFPVLSHPGNGYKTLFRFIAGEELLPAKTETRHIPRNAGFQNAFDCFIEGF